MKRAFKLEGVYRNSKIPYVVITSDSKPVNINPAFSYPIHHFNQHSYYSSAPYVPINHSNASIGELANNLLPLKSSIKGIVGLRKVIALQEKYKHHSETGTPLYMHLADIRGCIMDIEIYKLYVQAIKYQYNKAVESIPELFNPVIREAKSIYAEDANRLYNKFSNYIKANHKSAKEFPPDSLHHFMWKCQRALVLLHLEPDALDLATDENAIATFNTRLKQLYGRDLKIFGGDFIRMFKMPIPPIKDLYADFCSTNTQRKFLIYDKT